MSASHVGREEEEEGSGCDGVAKGGISEIDCGRGAFLGGTELGRAAEAMP